MKNNKINLKFFKDICQQLHLTSEMLAGPETKQAVSYMFCADDAKLSTLQKRLRCCGYCLEPIISFPEEEKPWYEVKFIFELPVSMNQKNSKDSLLIQRAGKSGRIQFLAKFILDYRKSHNLNIGQFCNLVDMEYMCFRRILETQDCKVSQLAKICQATGAFITWRVSKI